MSRKIAFITGASAGIGAATAKLLASQQYNLILAARRVESLKKLSDELTTQFGISTLVVKLDVRNRNEVAETIAAFPKDWQKINVLVNNAGLASGLSSIDEGDMDDWDVMIDTNVKGLLYVTRNVIPLMKSNESGHIINIGSIAGKDVYPNGVVYCATKHAVDALSKGMRMDFLPYNIKVTQICPGAVETEFSLVRFKGNQDRADQVYAGFENLVADDIAEAVYYAVSQPAHVNIQDVLVMPTAQASGSLFHKEIK